MALSGLPTILIIDDEEDILEMYAAKFTEAGFKVLTAHDGYEGIETAKQDQPDLILLDVLMPGMTGTDVLLKLKEDSTTRDIQVMFLTSLPERPEDVKAAKDAGAVDFLSKNIELDELVEILQKFVDIAPAK